MKSFNEYKEIIEEKIVDHKHMVSWNFVEKVGIPHRLFILYDESSMEVFEECEKFVINLYLDNKISSREIIVSGHTNENDFIEDMDGTSDEKIAKTIKEMDEMVQLELKQDPNKN